MSDIVLKVENLSKVYRLGEVGTGTISHDLNRWWARVRGKEDPFSKVGSVNDRTQKAQKGEYVKALSDINFEVKQGEVLGIIGKNGAGKSTLLKVISQITSPTTGSIKAKGRIASLLEVGTGMHPEMTGRENVYLNGTILGMTKREIDAKFEEIMDFAGCAKYADTPVKRYSSGMKVRLGFAVAAFLEPEILIVDEVLAVGDAEFQKKAIGKMQDISEGGGRTVLFVSHNMASVRSICNRGLLIENGNIKRIGKTNNIVNYYLYGDSLSNGSGKAVFNDSEVGGKINLVEAFLKDSKGNVRVDFLSDENISIELKFKVTELVKGLRLIFSFFNSDGVLAFASTNHTLERESNFTPGVFLVRCTLPREILNQGMYRIYFSAGIPGVENLYKPREIFSINVESSGHHGSNIQELWPGVLAPSLNWERIIRI